MTTWSGVGLNNEVLDYRDQTVGVGGYGTVKVAELDGIVVAVKELRVIGGPNDRARFATRFARELSVWTRLDHPNLLKLCGYHLSRDLSIALFISPFLTYGNVGKYLEEIAPPDDIRYSLAEDTALGLQHLHNQGIVHGDLKDLNVLVNDQIRALLCDYGLARMINPDGAPSGMTSSGLPMSIRYASPELVNGSRQDLMSDMWAWGCLVVKIITNLNPYHTATELACVSRIIQGNSPADVSTLPMSPNFQNMLLRCWNMDPFARITVAESLAVLRKDRQDRERSKTELEVPVTSLWNKKAEISTQTLIGDPGKVFSVAMSPDSTLLATGSHKYWPQIWDVKTGALLKTLSGHTGSVRCVAFSPCGTGLATGSDDETLRIWDVASGRNTSYWLSLNKPVYCLAYSPDGAQLAFGSSDVRIRDTTSRRSITLYSNLDDDVRAVVFSPDGSRLAFGTENANLCISEVLRAGPLAKFEGHTEAVSSIAFSPDGTRLASGSEDMTIRIWDLAIGSTSMLLSGHSRWVNSVAFSPDGVTLASGSNDQTVQIWDVGSGELILTLRNHSSDVNSVAFSKDGAYDRTVKIRKNRHVRPFPVEPLAVGSTGLSEDTMDRPLEAIGPS